MLFQIQITPTALYTLESIVDRRIRNAILRRIDALTESPEQQGKRLRGLLTGFMSIRASGQRYRVVYTVEKRKARVVIYMVGIRKEGSHRDVYALAERLVKRGLI